MLQAKNVRGEKPFDVTSNKKVKEFLRTSENKKTVSSFRPFENYNQAAPKHTIQECEEYLLILSHLAQSYFRLTRARAEEWTNFEAHVNNLEDHVTSIVRGSRLSSVISIRLAAIRMLAC